MLATGMDSYPNSGVALDSHSTQGAGIDTNFALSAGINSALTQRTSVLGTVDSEISDVPLCHDKHYKRNEALTQSARECQDSKDKSIRHLTKLKPLSAVVNHGILDDLGMYYHERDFESSIGSSNTDESLDTICELRAPVVSYEDTADSVLENLGTQNDCLSEEFSSVENLLDCDSGMDTTSATGLIDYKCAEVLDRHSGVNTTSATNSENDKCREVLDRHSGVNSTSAADSINECREVLDCHCGVNTTRATNLTKARDTEVLSEDLLSSIPNSEHSVNDGTSGGADFESKFKQCGGNFGNKEFQEVEENCEDAKVDVFQKRLPDFYYQDSEPIHMSISDIYPNGYSTVGDSFSSAECQAILRNKEPREDRVMKKSLSCDMSRSGQRSAEGTGPGKLNRRQ